MSLVIVAWRKLSYRTLLFTKALPDTKLWFFKDSLPYFRAMISLAIYCFIHKPRTILVQLPQGFLLFEAILLKKLLKINVIADVHTGFVVSSGVKGYLLNKFFVRFLSSANLVLVHNETIKSLLSSAVRKKTLVVYDPWMYIDTPEDITKESKDDYLVFPASFAPDEPLKEICDVINNLCEFRLVVTGDYNRQPEVIEFKSKYVQFVGFLPRKEYERLLINSSGIITGSTREFTVCMSSWEAVAYTKPLFLTDTVALKTIFKDYAVFFDWKNGDSLVSALKNRKKDLRKSRENLLKLSENSLQQLLMRPEITKNCCESNC